jgi:SOS-response transcriptional repressor LexA
MTASAELRRAALLAWLRQHFADHPGHSPTRREIQAGVGAATDSTITYDLRALRAAGKVEFEDGKAGTLRLAQAQLPALVERPLPRWRRFELAKYSGER